MTKKKKANGKFSRNAAGLAAAAARSAAYAKLKRDLSGATDALDYDRSYVYEDSQEAIRDGVGSIGASW